MRSLLHELFNKKNVIWSLAKNEIRSRYLGSYLGGFWVFILPIVNVLVVWFAFEFGLKVGAQQGVPMIVWLITGMVPWSFFAESLPSVTSSILEKPYLVKKMVFNVELLPLVKIIASLLPFVFLFFVMIGILLSSGVYPSIYWLQVPYYLICLLSLVLAIAWSSSSVVVFYRDFSQIVAVGLQVGFWATPIIWSTSLIPERFEKFINLNPMAYVVAGFRDSFFGNTWFWNKPFEAAYYWAFVAIMFFVGLRSFRKLKPHFADVL